VRELEVRAQTWPVRGRFAISRGAKTEVRTVIAAVHQDGHVGRGECTPYPRYDETPEGVTQAIAAQGDAVAGGLSRADLQATMPPGAARNALDCALWDLEAKLQGVPAWQLAGLAPPRPLTTAYTLSLDTAEAMGANAAANAGRPLLKLKLTGAGDLDRVRAVRANAPDATLIVDANEAWTPAIYADLVPRLVDLGVAMVEQPLPAADDAALADLDRPIAICADESCHDSASLPELAGRYDVVNIKLDKAGGLTEALALRAAARAAGYRIMVGCMIASSLAMAPAALVAQGADFVDLDGPLLLAEDWDPPLRYDGSTVAPPEPDLWG
jgi:L-alanine-DL-glutamate epimerase-like enolase superfamily enzyme